MGVSKLKMGDLAGRRPGGWRVWRSAVYRIGGRLVAQPEAEKKAPALRRLRPMRKRPAL